MALQAMFNGIEGIEHWVEGIKVPLQSMIRLYT